MLKARVITALFLLAGFLAVLFWPPFAGWMVFSALVAGLGAWEWGGLIKLDRASRWGYASGAMAACMALALSAFDIDSGVVTKVHWLAWAYVISVVFWGLAVPAWLRVKWALPGGLSGMLLGWVLLLPACLALMQLRAISPILLLATMAAVWVADIAAYFCGRAFGRHKLAPSVSPGKTWEGALGALIGVLVYGFVAAWYAGKLIAVPPLDLALFGLALAAFTAVSIIGDLFESLAKRKAGVKDSGNLLPGHGGVLDRIDSLTSTLPLAGLALLLSEGQIQWLQ